MSESHSEPIGSVGTSEPTSAAPPQERPSAPQPQASRARFRIGAVVVIAIVVGLIVWLAVRHNSKPSTSTGANNVTAVSVAQIRNLATSVGHPVFWLGPVSGDTYELTRQSNGSIFIRYLPAGVSVGSSKPYPTVATYPFVGAYAALQRVAKQRNSTSAHLANGGLAVLSGTYPYSVHVAYPKVDYQIEVYNPTAGAAISQVTSGKLEALGGLIAGSASAASGPAAASVARLRSLTKLLGHDVYWVGTRPGDTYELTQSSNGQVYIRYLPHGVKVGTSKPYLAVGTYPFVGAYAALKAVTKEKGIVSFKLAGGGLAELDPHDPTSIHLAFPGSDTQVEIFAPSPAVVRNLVTSNQVKAIGS